MAETATLAGTITLNDSTNGQFSKALSAAFAGTISAVSGGLLIPNADTPVTLPIASVHFVYIKNLHATNTLTVSWTPNGGASNPVATLKPSGILILIEPVTGSGITALSLNASGASTPVEYILVG